MSLALLAIRPPRGPLTCAVAPGLGWRGEGGGLKGRGCTAGKARDGAVVGKFRMWSRPISSTCWWYIGKTCI